MRYCPAIDVAVSTDQKGAQPRVRRSRPPWEDSPPIASAPLLPPCRAPPPTLPPPGTHIAPRPPLPGFIEYWGGTTLKHPPGAVSFSLKMDTDLFALAAAKTAARSLDVARDGGQFAAFCGDGRVRVWRLRTGKLRRIYDESLEVGGGGGGCGAGRKSCPLLKPCSTPR
jgi:hypothetical protein